MKLGKQYKNNVKHSKTENMKKNQTENFVLKNIITELKNSIKSFYNKRQKLAKMEKIIKSE